MHLSNPLHSDQLSNAVSEGVRDLLTMPFDLHMVCLQGRLVRVCYYSYCYYCSSYYFSKYYYYCSSYYFSKYYYYCSSSPRFVHTSPC